MEADMLRMTPVGVCRELSGTYHKWTYNPLMLKYSKKVAQT